MSYILFSFIIWAVFNVTDHDGNKITDVEVLDYIHKVSCFPILFYMSHFMNEPF